MDKVREKACRLFTDVKLGKQGEHGVVNGKESHLPCNVEAYFKCCYCPKVFVNSKYSIKHILRRHTDNLLSLLDKLIDASKSGSDKEHVSAKNVINILTGYFDIKKELESLKQHVDNHISQKSCDELNQTIDEPSSIKNDKVTENVKLSSDEPISSITKFHEFDEIRTKIFEIEGFVKELCIQVENLQIVMKENISFKQEIQKKISHDENKIVQNQKLEALKLKQVLMSELQHMFQEKNDEKPSWEKQYPDLKTELDKHYHLLQCNYQQINSPVFLKQLESNLEKKLCWLIDSSKATENRKIISKYPKQHSKSLKSKSTKSVTKEPCKSTDQVKDIDAVPEKSPLDVKFLLQQKLQNLSISPDANQISTPKYMKKMHLLNTERQLLCTKYKNFMEVYNNIDSYADQKALAKMRARRSRKIKFSRSIKSPQYQMHSISLNSPTSKNHQSKKQESTGFVVTDVGACGDFKFSSLSANEDNASILSSRIGSINENSDRRVSNNQYLAMEFSKSPATSNLSFPNLDKENFDELSLQSLSSLSDEEIQRTPSSYFKPVSNIA